MRIHLAEQTRRLGRHVHHDPRSKAFLADRAPIKSVQHASVGLPLDQGNVGKCTAEAIVGALNSAPDFDGGRPLTDADATAIYERETQLEGQPYPPNDPGGSGLMVCKAAKAMGLIHSYRHALGLQHALEALVLRPMIVGMPWYSTFDEPDASGLVVIGPHATIRGGHEVCADGIDAEKELVWFWNSWGKSYGVGGRFCMSFATLERLLAEQGDVTVPLMAAAKEAA